MCCVAPRPPPPELFRTKSPRKFIPGYVMCVILSYSVAYHSVSKSKYTLDDTLIYRRLSYLGIPTPSGMYTVYEYMCLVHT